MIKNLIVNQFQIKRAVRFEFLLKKIIKHLHRNPESTNFASRFTSTICENSSAGRAQPCQG
jgi:hypothetical protein